MTGFSRILLSPDGAATAGAGGSPASPPAAATSNGTAGQSSAPAAPQAQPQVVTISPEDHQRFQRYEQQVKTSNSLWDKARQHGYANADDALADLQRMQTIKKDPNLTGILEAMVAPHTAQPNGTASPAPASVDQNTVQQMIAREFEARSQKDQQERYNAAAQTETRLLNELIGDQQLRPLLGDIANYDDAFGEKSTRTSRAVATLIDAELFALAPKLADGRAMPVTDSAMIRQARDNVLTTIRELKSAALIEASRGMTDVQTPRSVEQPAPDFSNENPALDFGQIAQHANERYAAASR